jgi:serine/threonine protein kinase
VWATSAISAGERIGRYEVIKHLATGGMAEIYLARVSTLPGLDKLVVLKRILPELAAQPEFVQMFIDEARIATLLDHPHVVQTFDAGVVDGKPYLAMEYLHGAPVSALMARLQQLGERLDLAHALAIAIAVAAGLHYAHERVGLDGRALNIVHRDVTPQNVIVTYDGGVKLVDFGIARSAHRVGRTRYGTIKGKVPYMSPEQCRNEALDRRSDIFSLGIMIYELTLGRRLFRGKSDYEVLKQIVEGQVAPPHTIDAGYDAGLEAIVMRALDKDRNRRPASARELQGELEAVARAAHLPVSSLALQQLMERCFGARIQVLRDAQARGNLELLSEIVELDVPSEELDELEPAPTAAVGDATSPLVAPAEEQPTFVASPAAARIQPRRQRVAWLVGAGVDAS